MHTQQQQILFDAVYPHSHGHWLFECIESASRRYAYLFEIIKKKCKRNGRNIELNNNSP